VIKQDSIKNGGFKVIVSGQSKGCGSSRETGALQRAEGGRRARRRAQHREDLRAELPEHRPLTTTDFSLLERSWLARIPVDEFTEGPRSDQRGHRPRTAASSPTTRSALAGELVPPPITTAPRPMTLVEKILAKHAIVDAKTGQLGVPAVQPGDALFVRTDVRFSHEYVTPMAEALFVDGRSARTRRSPTRRASSRSAITSPSSAT
jgi:3-isopropylmalate/(R)-2-methylmalate dehydratase large subunit